MIPTDNVKRIFVSGKVTGDKDYKKKFENKRKYLQKSFPDATIITPTDVDLTGCTWEESMAVTVPLMKTCQMVYFIKDWTESKGAKEEHDIAERLALMTLEEMPEYED